MICFGKALKQMRVNLMSCFIDPVTRTSRVVFQRANQINLIIRRQNN